MGQTSRQGHRDGAANLHGLARVEREKRWTTIMDVALALSALAWLTTLTTVDVLPPLVGTVLPLVIGAMTTHRLLLVLERRHRAHATSALPLEVLTQTAPDRQDARAA